MSRRECKNGTSSSLSKSALHVWGTICITCLLVRIKRAGSAARLYRHIWKDSSGDEVTYSMNSCNVQKTWLGLCAEQKLVRRYRDCKLLCMI